MDFSGRSELVPIRTQSVPQTIETPVTFVPVPGAYVRYAYLRSSDSMASRIEGQDYLCFRHNDQRLVFVVCDGVGSSFCGNLAARILGDALLDWLWSLDIAYLGGAAALGEAATSFLNRLQRQAQHEVEEYEIRGEMSGLVRQALEGQRAYGSEAVFAAARIDHPNPLITDGLVSVCWMGDTQIHLFDESGEGIEIGALWESTNRWSTVQGARGKMSAWMEPLEGIGRLMAFSDGLSLHADRLPEYSDDRLDREIRAGARLPSSDDVAFIDVVIRSPRYEGYPDPELPDPNAARPHLEQIWNPTGEDTYELRWSWKRSDSPRFLLQEAPPRFIVQEAGNPALTDSRVFDVPSDEMSWRPSEAQSPGHYYYRVRAVHRRGTLTPWSELRQTKVASPPPPAPTLHLPEPGKLAVLTWSEEGDTLDYKLEQSTGPDFAEPEVVYEGPSTSWAVPINHKPGKYYFRVCAVSDDTHGPWSEIQPVEVTLPPPPRPHLATAGYGLTRDSYELRWQPVPGAKTYELEEVERESEATQIITLTDTIHHVVDKEVGEYIYRVRACHEFGCSEWSNEQLVVVTPERPSEAPVLTLEGPDEKLVIHLQWTEVPGATQYVVEVSEDDTFRNARVYTQTECTLDFPRQEPGLLNFRVCGVNSGGEGPWSQGECVAIAPNTPAWIEVNLLSDERRAAVTWGEVSGHVTYCLQMAIGPGDMAAYSEIYRGEDTQFELDLPGGGGLLRFQVRTELPGVESDWQESDALQIKPMLSAPRLEEPELNEQGEVWLHWATVEGASNYVLEAARDEAFTDAVGTIPTERTSMTFHPPASGRYWFRVKAAHQSHTGPPSNIVSTQARRPAPPQFLPLDLVRAGTPFELVWKGIPGCAFYEVQEASGDTFEPGKTRTTRVFHPSQKITLPGRPKGHYLYRVRAVGENDEASLWSNVLVVKVNE